MSKPAKTNAMRLLDRQHIPYDVVCYDAGDGAIDGVSVAHKVGRSVHEVYKTLVCRGASGAVLVFCLPVCEELDLKAAARAAAEKSVGMLPPAQITPVTGYVRGGVSPLGMKKNHSTFVLEEAQWLDTMLVSAGKIGLQIAAAPRDLAKAVNAGWFSQPGRHDDAEKESEGS